MFQGWKFFGGGWGGGGNGDVTALKLKIRGEGGCKENKVLFQGVWLIRSL